MRTTIKTIATAATIAALAITATGCKDLEGTGAGIDLGTTETHRERHERIDGPIVNTPSGEPYTLTPDEKHTRWQNEQTAEKRGAEDSYTDLRGIYERNGYDK